jgi:hypothetical protein
MVARRDFEKTLVEPVFLILNANVINNFTVLKAISARWGRGRQKR